jgi:tetratricopeptide (TPR) repeat protein
VLKIDPNHPNIHFRIGRTLLARAQAKGDGADVTEAATEFVQELQLDPSNANAAYELAEIHRKAGQLEDAQKYFEIAVANYPNFEEAHVGLAATLMALQNLKWFCHTLKKPSRLIRMTLSRGIRWRR